MAKIDTEDPIRTTVLKSAMWLLAVLCLVPLGIALSNLVQETYFSEPYDRARHSVIVHKRGEGSRIVLLLHGFAGASSYWLNRLPRSPQSTFLIPDLIGFGESPKPVGTYNLAMHVEAIISGLGARAMSIDTIVGHSMGAIIAGELATKLAHKSLVLVSLPKFNDRDEAAQSLSRVSMMHRAMIEDNIWIKASCFFRDAYKLSFLAPMFNLPADVYLSATDHTWISLSRSLKEVVLGTNTRDVLASLPGKPLLIHGTDDEVAPYLNVQRIADEFGFDLNAVDGGDHNFFLKQPSDLWQKVFPIGDQN